jgi:HEAT repeats
MRARVEGYRAELRALEDWEPYLRKHSGLPGARANLELVEAVGEEADADRLWRLSASSDEFLALCGTAGLGKVALMEPATVMTWLRELASDPRWRVREGVAIALQRIGRESMSHLLAEMQAWSGEGPYVQRAAAAGLCEPALLKEREHAVPVLIILDQITTSVAASRDRTHDGFRVLRQALGYCWSVAAAAAPENAQPYFEKWMQSRDKDVAWIMKTNLSKARMAGLRKELEPAT